MVKKREPRLDFYVHLVSDATGTTLQGLSRACLSQFDGVRAVERFWPLIRSERQMARVLDDIGAHKGPVLYTMVDPVLRQVLTDGCKDMDVPCLPVLDPIIKSLSSFIGLPAKGIPGLQYALDEAYFQRIDAIDYALHFDDGQTMDGLEDADVILVGVSRTSKTPTSIYLARRGIKAGNIPLVPHTPFPEAILALKKPIFVGLSESADRLLQIRTSRLKADMQKQGSLFGNAYIDPAEIEKEVEEARRFFRQQKWPVIDVTKKSVEEIAAEIMFLLQKKRGAA
ncbi:MAG: pyruvate, phosphate dikinase/phosphoenolpyruvate synthase regulator [Alphaproteobacteria bacterium]|nr:pyruvate, phosphate dikinase/phosphoenolpyruvate synthase regulator [Alphaproteobacteria bacterium]